MVTSLALIYPSGMIASILIFEASYLLRVNGNLAKIRASTYLSPEEKGDHLLSKSQRMPEVQGCFCFSLLEKVHQIWHGPEKHIKYGMVSKGTHLNFWASTAQW